mgnify:FL=1
MGVGYFTIDPTTHEGFYDVEYLDSMPASYESEAVRIVTFPSPLLIGINGKQGKGVVVKPKSTPDNSNQ